MIKIDEIDVNFKIGSEINKSNVKFYDTLQEPFKIYGVFLEDEKFRRMPQNVAESINKDIAFLNVCTAGGRVRFKTDSSYVALHAEMTDVGFMSHFALTGSAGFDMYVRSGEEELYAGTFRPPYNVSDSFEGIIELDGNEMCEITINFPLYSGVKRIYLGFEENARIEESRPYRIEKPVVYYGSSITQGACTSRPGNCYQGIISRRYDCNYINLGFSGNATADRGIVDYIKTLDMSMFVYDYDYNAPDEKYLLDTHERMFKDIRKEHPKLPVIIMSRPAFYLNESEKERLRIIKATYDNAVASGDKNVYFISGPELMAMAKGEGTVDNCHPNDLGFASIAKALGDLIEREAIL